MSDPTHVIMCTLCFGIRGIGSEGGCSCSTGEVTLPLQVIRDATHAASVHNPTHNNLLERARFSTYQELLHVWPMGALTRHPKVLESLLETPLIKRDGQWQRALETAFAVLGDPSAKPPNSL